VNGLPSVKFTPRAHRDIKQCTEFVRLQPWGKPQDRLQDIYTGIGKILFGPHRAPIRARRPSSGLDLRRCDAAQFVVVYAYIPPNRKFPLGGVSIRAVRHRRVKNIFAGVKEREVHLMAPKWAQRDEKAVEPVPPISATATMSGCQ
jgi:hypothetical protein